MKARMKSSESVASVTTCSLNLGHQSLLAWGLRAGSYKAIMVRNLLKETNPRLKRRIASLVKARVYPMGIRMGSTTGRFGTSSAWMLAGRPWAS